MCTSLQTDNYTPAPHHSIYTSQIILLLMPNQGCESIEDKFSKFTNINYFTAAKNCWYLKWHIKSRDDARNFILGVTGGVEFFN